MSADPITVAHLFSTSYAGSTWLNLMLGAHPRAFSVGEVKAILKVGRAVCTLHGDDCPVWSRYDASSDESVYLQLKRITGKRLLVVNNSRKFLPHEQAPGVDARYIHLIRDGRAVVASHLRKYPDQSLRGACGVWKREVRRNWRLVRRMARAGRPTLTVYYENLQRDTAGELDRVCRFLGVDFDGATIDYSKADPHFLGGNRGTLMAMMDQQGRDLPPDPHRRPPGEGPRWDLDYYRRRQQQQGFRDERWKTQLTDAQLRLFGLFAGRLNRRLGYPASTDRESSVTPRL